MPTTASSLPGTLTMKMSSPQSQPRALGRALCCLALALLLGAAPGGAAQEELHPKIAKALSQLDKGRTARAEKAFAALLDQQPELAFDVRLARAEFSNRKEQPEAAAQWATEAVELAGNPTAKARAVTELLIAETSLGQLSDTFPESLASLRGLLSGPDDATSDKVRIGVCRIRELLPDEHPESLTSAAMPGGKVKYLPRVEDGSSDQAIRPERIRDREAIPTAEQAKSMSGRVSAEIQGTIDADGCFAKARVSSTGDKTFEQIALGAVRGWVYRPARFNGTPVSLFFSSTITFDAGDPGKPVY